MAEQDQLHEGKTMKNQTQVQGLSREAGRALDALIAEKVMGWRAWRERRGEYALCVAVPGGARDPWLSARHPEPERYEAVSCADALRIGFYGTEFPAYSTNIAAAWLVVEKMRTLDYDVIVGCPPALTDSSYCEVARLRDQGSDVEYAATAPLAICLAALVAVEVPHV